ncbi:MAG: hypothetical protein HeimC2_33210 [Candidatus Heimdallarchaeota archaeon LC_2]|nr:MAG: hypothetical protein HeimC2_35040 [Candidatus Heimdallarchaeota archaeon LC_2]OLS21489.1 MAG: hypothetical protein HeimC2_33210 [Candidatus Heimdallarchaeota archaeon LC_2]
MKLELSQILKNLTQMAKEDGKVTQNEEDFLNTLRKDIEQFQNSVNYATQDDYISDDQLHDIIILRDRILTDSLQFSTESEEVDNLVNELYNLINDFMIPGINEEELSE